MKNEGLRPAFIKPVRSVEGLQKPFTKLSEAQYRYRLATIEKCGDHEYYLPDQVMGRKRLCENGEEMNLMVPLRKGIPSESVSAEEYYRAQVNRLETANWNMKLILSQEHQNVERLSTPDISPQRHIVFLPDVNTERYGTYYKDVETGKIEWICNFKLLAECIIQVLNNNQQIKKQIKFRVQLEDAEETLVMDVDRIDTLGKEVTQKVLGTIISAVIPKAEAKLGELFRQTLRNLTVEMHQQAPGWMEWNGRRLFAHDSRKLYGLVMETGMAILASERYKGELLRTVTELLSMGSSDILAPMVGVCLLAPLHELFKNANVAYEPHFALFINGPSGSLKTAVAKTVFSMYNANEPNVPASFRDTPTAVEMRLREYSCSPVLLDDFYSTGIRKEQQEMQKILEMVIRYVGDGIGKNRSNPKLQNIKGVPPSGMVIITGEDTAGQLSTLLRCLILNVSKGTFSKKVLTAFQNEPLKWSTFLHCFINFVEENYERIVNALRQNYLDVRQCYKCEFEDLRPVDQLTQLHLTFMILKSFLTAVEPERVTEIQNLCEVCIAGCFQAVKTSQEYANINSGERQYPTVMAKLIFDGTIRIAENRVIYATRTSDYDGFESEEYYFLRSDSVYAKVRNYFFKQGRELTITALNANRSMDRLGLLITETENAGTEKQKKLFEVKVKVGNNRPRMLKIIKEALKGMVEK